MVIIKAVVRTAMSFGVLSTLFAVLISAQTAPAKAPIAQPGDPAAGEAQQQVNKEQEDLRKEIRELKQGQEEIRKDLIEIKKMLLVRQPPAKPAPPEKISIADRPARGNETARIVIVEFSDYQCPFCGRFFRETLPQLDQTYIKTGKIKYVYNNVPLDQLHPSAFKAAEAAECAGDQGKFWEMHDKIFANQRTLSASDLTTHAREIGLDMTLFGQCLDSGKNTSSVRAGLALAEDFGVDGTPTFVIALADPRNPKDRLLKVLGIIPGAQPFAVFKSVLDKALATP